MKITFLGGGNMASALIGGLLKQGFAAADLQVVDPDAGARQRLGSIGVRTHEALDATAVDCDVLVLAVKPQQMREALKPLIGMLGGQLVVSIAAGVRLADLSRWLGGHALLVRAMPNTPALIGLGMTGLHAGAAVSATQRAQVEQILAAVGQSAWVEDEALVDAVTALSGSGPAYVFHFIEALQDGGEKLGLPSDVALKLALQTLVGASALAAQSAESPAVLRERVTSKGGTTEAALKRLTADGFAGMVERALADAAKRGAELGEQLGRE